MKRSPMRPKPEWKTLARRTRGLAQRSKRRDDFEKDLALVTPAVIARSKGLCEFKGVSGGCLRVATVIHHKIGRVGSEANWLGHLLHLCNAHHQYCHSHPAESYEFGMMIHRNSSREVEHALSPIAGPDDL